MLCGSARPVTQKVVFSSLEFALLPPQIRHFTLLQIQHSNFRCEALTSVLTTPVGHPPLCRKPVKRPLLQPALHLPPISEALQLACKLSSESYNPMAENRYIVGYAKLGTSSCKKCKQKIEKGALRIGKVVSNPFSEDGGDMKQWFHPTCIFETFVRARATTKKIEEPDDVEGFADLEDEDKSTINRLIKEFHEKAGATPKKKATVQSKLPFYSPKKEAKAAETKASPSASSSGAGASSSPPAAGGALERDNAFREFRRLCAMIAEQNSYLSKTQIVADFLKKGTEGDGFKGDVYLWLKMLLPGVVKTVYNLNSKQLVKLFSQIFGTSQKQMIEDLEQGDVAETVRVFFEQSKLLPPQQKSYLTMQEVDAMLEELSTFTKEEDQQKVLTKIAKKATANDLKMVVRLIKHDLRINSGAKHILDGLDSHAYAAFQASRNLRDVVDRVLEHQNGNGEGKPGLGKKLSIRASLMTPVLPMLAEACRSVEYAMKKCPNGFFAEIKYDGERVQVHKSGNEFRYFSRSLKPVMPHKVNHFKDFIPKAFPGGNDLILDSEVLLVDNATSKPLPFGSLGVHKKAAFKDATVCLFIFDCLHLNGESLMQKPIQERRKILLENMTEIPNRIALSEIQHVTKPADLQKMMDKVFKEGLEGLVLKDVNSHYEPGKRHWLKIKKDYLHEGSMADSADLIVLGGYFGTGNKGGIMSTFLMGLWDPARKKFCTVTKVTGFEDKVLDRLQKEFDMEKIGKDAKKVPDWLLINKPVIPDFIVKDPKKSQVWEIIGAEFSKAEIHTADGISIRFPRVQKFREDKGWEDATDLPRLQLLYKQSKERTDIDMDDDENGDDDGGSTSNGNGDVDMGRDQTPKKAGKRSAEDSPAASPAKKSKPACKYGASCYQTSGEHKAKFYHPPSSTSSSSPSPAAPASAKPGSTTIFKYLTVNQRNSSSSTPNPPSSSQKKPEIGGFSGLKDIFTGCKIVIPENLVNFQNLKRYVIAYDGDVLSDIDRNEATHIITTKGKTPKTSGHAKAVTPEWLWQSIKKGRLLSPDAFQP